jgi:hypothetical protein
MTVYPKVSGLTAWSENCKWYSSLPLGAVVSLFLGGGVSLTSFATIPLRVASQLVFVVDVVGYFVIDTVRKLLDTPSYTKLAEIKGNDVCETAKGLCIPRIHHSSLIINEDGDVLWLIFLVEI